MKKFLTLIVVMILSLTMCFGCGKKGNDVNPTDSSSDGPSHNWQGTLKVIMFDGGYGSQWLKNIAAAYKKNNPRVKIDVKTTPAPAGELDSLRSGVGGYDVYFMIDNMYDLVARNKLADITAVYDYKEPGQDKRVRDKMNPIYVNEFNMKTDDSKEDSFYLLPWSNSQEGLIYNKTTTDKYFGKDKPFPLPRTSEELLEICEMAKNKSDNIVAFNYSGKNDYLPSLFVPWWAQYEGLESYYDYYAGYMTDKDGNRTFSKRGEVGKQRGRLLAWNVLERLCKNTNGYTHPRTDALDYNQSQLLFLNQGFAGDDKLRDCLFTLNGEWLENESGFALEEKPQDFRFVRTPVISEIIEKTPSIKNEKMLRTVIDYVDGIIDGKEVTKPTGVTDKDIEIISTARKIANSVGSDHIIGVNAKSKVIPLARDFLKFLTTKKAGEIYSKALNGLSLPYGAYNPYEDGVELSSFIKSRYEVFKDVIPVYQGRKPILTYRGGHCAFREKFGVKIFTGEKTGEDYFNENADYTQKHWRQMVKSAGLSDLLNQ